MARIKDADWIKQSFVLPADAIDVEDMKLRTLTEATWKFTDTTCGGNFAINAPPQFTRFADIKQGASISRTYARSSESSNSPSYGMGRYYSEAIDDNGQFVTMSFGVAQFNSLTSFFGNFYDPEASALARTGRSTSLFYDIGKVAGMVVGSLGWPFIAGAKVLRFLLNVQSSKYYYLKPTMPAYWNAVNLMANAIAVNMGLIPRVYSPAQRAVYGDGSVTGNASKDSYEAQAVADAAKYHELLPEIYKGGSGGGIDVYAMANRAQRLANQYNAQMEEVLNNATSTEDLKARLTALRDLGVTQGPTYYYSDYLQEYYTKAGPGAMSVDGDADSVDVEKATDKPNRFLSWFSQFFDEVGAGRQDGSNYITFRTDYSGPVGESFSNSTRESEVAQKMNNLSAQARMTRFNFEGGNISDGALGKLVSGAMGAVSDLVSGVAAGVGISGLAALGGAAFVDIPKMYDQSSTQLPTASFTISLRSPYGNKMSRFQNLYVPLCMLLAGALPISTGKRSYTSPFLCELYCRGRTQIRLGMIDSLTITRGVGNLGWTQEGEPLGIDISFSVVDMSSILHMPLVTSYSAWDRAVTGAGEGIDTLTGNANGTAENIATALASGAYDDDSAFTDYMAVLGSLSYTDQVYVFRKWSLNRTRVKADWESWRSPSHTASWALGTLPGRIITAVSRGTDRP